MRPFACSRRWVSNGRSPTQNDLGIGALPNVPSLALGSGEITLASLTSAYAAFAHAGVVNDPIFIRRVEDQDGTILFQAASKPRRAVSETTAFMMATMLADVIDAGTANRARVIGFTLPAAGKTGTTNDFVDAWFVGFTPKLVAGVWVGFDKPRTILKNAFAGQLAVPMWARFMKAATRTHGASLVRATSERCCSRSLPLVGTSSRRWLQERRIDQSRGRDHVQVDGLHRLFRARHRAVRARARCTLPNTCRIRNRISRFRRWITLGEAFGAIPEPAIAALPSQCLRRAVQAGSSTQLRHHHRRRTTAATHDGCRIFRPLHQSRHRNRSAAES